MTKKPRLGAAFCSFELRRWRLDRDPIKFNRIAVTVLGLSEIFRKAGSHPALQVRAGFFRIMR
jgi:hypothetical protein